MKRVTELDRETLKYYARMAAESFVDDPVHKFATKNVERRKVCAIVCKNLIFKIICAILLCVRRCVR